MARVFESWLFFVRFSTKKKAKIGSSIRLSVFFFRFAVARNFSLNFCFLHLFSQRVMR